MPEEMLEEFRGHYIGNKPNTYDIKFMQTEISQWIILNWCRWELLQKNYYFFDKARPVRCTMFAFSENCMLASYLPKKTRMF